jgi:hypothetical protein
MSPPLVLKQFSGLLPRVPDTALPMGAAIAAENIDFGYGELRSAKGLFKMRELAIAARKVFSDDGLRFYAWPTDVDAVVSPLQSGDASDRLYYTSGTDFRVTLLSLATIGGSTPTTSYRVGVPAPTVGPLVTVEHPADPTPPVATVDPDPPETYQERLSSAQDAATAAFNATVHVDTETRSYAYTYANAYNEEGPPSGATVVDVITITANGITTTSKVTVLVQFDPAADYVPITEARLYRSAGTNDSGNYFFTMSVRPGQPQVTDAIEASALNETLSSLDAYPPPTNLKGLFNIGNGILCAWRGKELWFSEAYQPWAWPPKYVVTVPHAIVGVTQHGAGALVTTVAEPCLITGMSPDAMAQIPLSISQAGASKWSLISIAGIALYACNDGLVAINGGQPSFTLSERFFTREVWRSRYASGLSSMVFATYDGKLFVFSNANKFTPFMIDMGQDGGQMAELPGMAASTALVLTTSDQMYLVNGNGLYQFAGGDPLPLRWMSGDIVLPAPVVLAAAQVECVGDFTVKFYQNGKLGFTQAVSTGSTVFRLPSEAIPGHAGLQPSDRWQFEITGSGRFKWLKAAASIRGLKEA